jgi:DNA repair protein RadC
MKNLKAKKQFLNSYSLIPLQLPLGKTAQKLNRLIPKKEKMLPVRKKIISKRGSRLFGKAVIKETINILPEIPITDSMQEVTEFLNDNLPFNSIQTRKRRARYIKFRMFNNRNVDFSLLKFEVGTVSQEKAAEIAALSRAEFISALNRLHVSPLQYSPKELSEELRDAD